MNLSNLHKLAQYLEIDAPFTGFSMDYFLEEYNDELYPTNNVCGTVCCIAGTAFLMSRDTWNYQSDVEDINVSEIALDFLGLKLDFESPFGHDLFDPELAPKDCTPQQAAKAVRRVMIGLEPWSS